MKSVNKAQLAFVCVTKDIFDHCLLRYKQNKFHFKRFAKEYFYNKFILQGVFVFVKIYV